MSDPVLRIFSYQPNPRIMKATIAARLCGLEVELRGAAPRDLQHWLWDFDARPLRDDERGGELAREARAGFNGALHKTDAFLDAHPFGTVPAAWSPDGSTGIFESNSILRAVGRLGQDRFALYGDDAYGAARIDSFLDASLIFARETQLYLFAVFGSDEIGKDVRTRTAEAFAVYMGGIDRALASDPTRGAIVGDRISLADICFATEIALFSNEAVCAERLAEAGLEPLVDASVPERFPHAHAHYDHLCGHEAFAPDLGPYLEKIRAKRGIFD